MKKHILSFFLTLLAGASISTLFWMSMLFTEQEVFENSRKFWEAIWR